jgi:GNAT superfamily N-acetyltransferase
VSDLSFRRATPDDLRAILTLLRVSMHRHDDGRFEELFRWKHVDNAYGPSLMWVACAGDRVVGFRVFMRWRFEREGEAVDAVRAVDTVTHPDFQGRGIFTRLTLQALQDARDDGVDFVYNTPNDQSRPGYLKMGWQVVGRAPASFRPTRIASLPALLQARTAAAHWSEVSDIGVPFESLLGETAALEHLLASRRSTSGLRTATTRSSLAWRYGNPVLGYRAVLASDDVRDGVAVLRIRRRGSAREAALVELIVPEGGSMRLVLREVASATRRNADYILAVGQPYCYLPLPKAGPIVTTRAITSDAPTAVEDFDFSLGDVELF